VEGRSRPEEAVVMGRGSIDGLRRALALGSFVLGAAVAPAWPDAARAEERSLGEQVGLGAAAGVGTLVYSPAKIAYSIVGGVVGGLTYVVTLGDEETADAVWKPALGGSYVLTPDMIAGQESVDFVGPREEGPTRTASAAQWPD
jgi:hypothetical protein